MHASSLDEVAVAQQIDYVPRRGFSSGVVSASRTCHSRSGIPLAIPPLSLSLTLPLSLLSKNCNALARDPLSIPLLNLRPYYRMPRERGASRRPKGADIEIQHASKPSKRRRPRRFHAVAERGGGSA